MRTTRFWIVLAVLTLMMMASGCGEPPVLYPTNVLMGGASQGDFEAKVNEAEQHWANRADKAQLEKAIAAWEEAITLSSTKLNNKQRKAAIYKVYHSLSRAHYFLADGHLRFAAEDPMSPSEEDPVKALMEEKYEKGVKYGEMALAVYSDEYNMGRAIDRPLSKIIGKLDIGAVPAMYWWATNLGRWALSKGISNALEQINDIKAVMGRVQDLQPGYFHHAPLRYFGAFYTTTPGGKQLDKSRKLFEQAIDGSPKYLGTKVLFASFYAYAANNDLLMEQMLRQAIAAPVGDDPNIKPENESEQKKAKLLLKEHFD